MCCIWSKEIYGDLYALTYDKTLRIGIGDRE
jgi:hypothetical protein